MTVVATRVLLLEYNVVWYYDLEGQYMRKLLLSLLCMMVLRLVEVISLSMRVSSIPMLGGLTCLHTDVLIGVWYENTRHAR